jgi:peptidyl-prolyl cis-trans isomerase SurA
MDESAYRENTWTPADFVKDEVVISFGDKKFKQSDLVQFYQSKQPLLMSADLNIFLEKMYQTWVEEQLLAYEDSRLESKFADFRVLMKEYREGILLFDLTDQMVWSKAVTDTTGLQEFHASNGSKYMYQARTDADIFTVIDAKTAKSIRKAAGKKKNTHAKLLSTHNSKNPLTLKINSGKFETGSTPILALFEQKTGLSDIKEHNGQFVFVRINALLEPSVKPLSEIRGLATSDYQQHLEREWIKDLESRYKVVVNKDTFNSILPK